ncbi:MAG: HD domain-containing protein, partial [Silvanigrellaceae bacterium]|nr:HD domain-containing protein [Silvanigrellaceae bacterium]
MSKTKLNINNNVKLDENIQLIYKNLDELFLIAESNKIQINEKLIKKAFLINYEVNKNRILKSGLPSYTLNLKISKLICNYLKLDEISIIAVFLCDISFYNSEYDYNFIKNEFGLVVAEIVDGINQFRNIESNSIESKDLNKLESLSTNKLEQQKYIDNYRKLLLSLFKDVRIILIKLVERLVLMRDLIYFSPEEREKISNETLQLYVPYASRFGLSQIKSELEDLTFKFLNPNEYKILEQKLSGTYEDRENYINEFITPIKEKLISNEFLTKNKISFEISGRAKHIYSIYNKIIIRSIPLEQLNDIVAMRIVIDSEDENLCFYFYGLIANLYPPVPETFKDYK